jgi:hypothetical protein
MSSVQKKTIYFSEAGEQNTDAVLKFAKVIDLRRESKNDI